MNLPDALEQEPETTLKVAVAALSAQGSTVTTIVDGNYIPIAHATQMGETQANITNASMNGRVRARFQSSLIFSAHG